MTSRPGHPLLIKRAKLVWYAITLPPLLALVYFSFSAALPPLVGLLALFLCFFWLFSFGFALSARFRKPPRPRQ
ncbi:MAG TPA: hypothetical protein GYA10_05270 [Alphaproteobacteria bacterium]|nr:hypothetical protein [Alphaproteobacteria bacterium]